MNKQFSPFTSTEINEINAAIIEAEHTTSAEIVPVVIKKVNQGKITAVKVLVKILKIFSVSLIFALSYLTFIKEFKTPFIWLSIGCAVILFICARLTMWSKKEFQKMLIKRAEDEYRELGINQTLYSNGVLILISVQDRQLVVFADNKILNSGHLNTWNEIVLNFQTNVKKHSLKFALIRSIKEVGLVCVKVCPKDSSDLNEIKNEIIIKG